MAKSIRSKVKKKHRSYMRQTIGEKVRTKNIEAAAKRLADKKKGRGNTKTLSYIKGALGGAGEVDLGQAYYSAIVKHAREPDASEAMARQPCSRSLSSVLSSLMTAPDVERLVEAHPA